MVKTFANIWLDVQQPLTGTHNSVSRAETLLDIPDEYSLDDVSIIASVQKLMLAMPDTDVPSTTSVQTHASTIFTRNKFLKTAYMHIIRECISQLFIFIGVHGPQVGEFKITPFMFQPIDERFDLTGKDFDNRILGAKYTNLHKLHKDVTKIISTMEQLYDEIKIFSTCTYVDTVVHMHQQMLEDEEDLIAEYEMKVNIFQSLQTEFVTYEKKVREKIFKVLDDSRTKATQNLNDIHEYGTAEVSYITRFEDSRKEQNLMLLHREENELKSIIHDNANKMNYEHIIHDNLTKYCIEAQNDYYGEIDDLMAKYDKDLEDMDNTIFEMKLLVEKTRDEKEEVARVCNERDKQMKDWLEYKRKKQEKLARKIRKNRAATKIQVWWREVMFRKKLGPYRPKKDKKGKKGDKKNKTRKNKK